MLGGHSRSAIAQMLTVNRVTLCVCVCFCEWLLGAGLRLASSYVLFPTLTKLSLFSYFLFNSSHHLLFFYYARYNCVSTGKKNETELLVNPPSDVRSFDMSSPAAVHSVDT